MQLNLKATTGNSLCFSYINNISIVRTFPRGEELLCRDQDLHYGSYEDSISPPKNVPVDWTLQKYRNFGGRACSAWTFLIGQVQGEFYLSHIFKIIELQIIFFSFCASKYQHGASNVTNGPDDNVQFITCKSGQHFLVLQLIFFA